MSSSLPSPNHVLVGGQRRPVDKRDGQVRGVFMDQVLRATHLGGCRPASRVQAHNR